jgi:hypothetical protein
MTKSAVDGGVGTEVVLPATTNKSVFLFTFSCLWNAIFVLPNCLVTNCEPRTFEPQQYCLSLFSHCSFAYIIADVQCTVIVPFFHREER